MLFLFFTNLYSDVNILVHPRNLSNYGLGDRAAQIIMIYNIKRTLSLPGKIYLYLNPLEIGVKKFSQLLGFDFKKNEEYPIRVEMETLSFVIDKGNSDFIVITDEEKMKSMNYNIAFCFSNSINQFLEPHDDRSGNTPTSAAYDGVNYFKLNKNSTYKNLIRLERVTDSTKHEKVPFYIFPEIMNFGHNRNWDCGISKFKDTDYNVFPTSLNLFYVTKKSLLPDENIVVGKDFFLPKEYKYIDDPKFLASYFDNSNGFNTNFNTFIYLINIYKEMPLEKNYVWFHNSSFNNQKDLILFFQENASKYLKCNIIQENEKNEIENFLKSVKLFLIKRPFNLIEHAVLFKMANFPIGCTGDISLSLALRYSKYKPIYEIAPWKESFFDGFLSDFKVSYFPQNMRHDYDQNGSISINFLHSIGLIELNNYMQKNNPTFTELIVDLIHNVVDKSNS